jgi:3-isopropylmalate/(R)-2-methylmalate dehydratase small subunit
MIIRDRVIKYGNNINTDVIIPARYLNTTEEDELALHCFENLDKNFKQKARDRKIIVAGDNFGCGSSREHAPLSIKASGIKLVIAKTFARIFFRNAINIGLPVIPSAEAAENIDDRDKLEVNLDKGLISNLTTGRTFKVNPVPEFIQEIIASGGYVNYTKKKMGELSPLERTSKNE